MKLPALTVFASIVLMTTATTQAQRSSPFDDWDADNDGFVSKSEFPERFPATRFDQEDTDRDGKISRTEDEAYRGKNRAGREQGRLTQATQNRERVAPANQNLNSRIPEGTRIEKDIIYETVNGRELPLDLYRPANATEPFPLIIWIHGGGWKGGSKSGINRCVGMLERGYAIASVEYRLSGEAIFPAAVEDCKAAVSFLRLNAKKFGLDPDRFGAWGSSAGGHLVAMLGVTSDDSTFETLPVTKKASSKVQAVCNWFGPTDFLRMNDFPGKIDHDAPDSPESRFIGAPIQDNKKLVQKANPITYISSSDPPILHMHGDNDQSVPYNQSELLHAALQKVGADTELYRVKNGGHGFRDSDESAEALFERAAAFFDKQFK
jgi:acetyl esterase/lipase